MVAMTGTPSQQSICAFVTPIHQLLSSRKVFAGSITSSRVCSRRRRSWHSLTRARASAPSRESILTASDAVDRLYGDADDENQEFFRWEAAQRDVAASRLLQQMHSSELTYGEFDLRTLGEALREGCAALRPAPAEKATFVDVGSGYGRSVHAAASMLGEAWACHGVEIVPGMHEYAVELLGEARGRSGVDWVDRVHFHVGDYSERGGEAEVVLSRADLVFIFATTWPTGGSNVLNTVTFRLSQLLRDGAVVMTVDKRLATDALGPDGTHFEHVCQFDGVNKCTGDSTVFVQRFQRGPSWAS